MVRDLIPDHEQYQFMKGRLVYMILAEPSIRKKEHHLELLNDLHEAYEKFQPITIHFCDGDISAFDAGDYVTIFDEDYPDEPTYDISYEFPYGACDECGAALQRYTYTEEVWGSQQTVEEYHCPSGCM